MVAAPQIVAEHLSAHGTLARAHLLALAGVEAVAAVGLLIRKLAAASTAVLLGVFTVAALIDASLGEVPAHLVLYAAITLLLRGEAPGGGVVSSAAPA